MESGRQAYALAGLVTVLFGGSVVFGARALFGGWQLSLVGVLVALFLLEGAFRVWRGAVSELATVQAQPRTHLVFLQTEVEEAGVTSGFSAVPTTASVSHTTTIVTLRAVPPNLFARVLAANRPPPGLRGLRADRVVAELEFYEPESGQLFLSIYGRWAETPQRAETGRLGIDLAETQLDIDANGLPHPLDIAMKRPGAGEMFAYNHENASAPGLELPKHLIARPVCRVRVTLRPANGMAVISEFELRSEGRGISLTALEPMDLPPSEAHD
jgi:hypothetical protein